MGMSVQVFGDWKTQWITLPQHMYYMQGHNACNASVGLQTEE